VEQSPESFTGQDPQINPTKATLEFELPAHEEQLVMSINAATMWESLEDIKNAFVFLASEEATKEEVERAKRIIREALDSGLAWTQPYR
jgi:hypothetical protein